MTSYHDLLPYQVANLLFAGSELSYGHSYNHTGLIRLAFLEYLGLAKWPSTSQTPLWLYSEVAIRTNSYPSTNTRTPEHYWFHQVDRYIDNKLGEAIQKAIMAHNLDCREEAQAEKRDYIELVDTSMRAIIKDEKNVTESLEAAVFARSSSQPKSTYEAAASLFEFKLTKILLDKMEERKSHLRSDYKKKLYDALVKSYNTDKDLFNTYGEVFTDSRSKEKKSSSTSKDASQSQHKDSRKSAHAEEPSHTIDDSGVQQDQEFNTGNNDEQLADKEVSKADCQVAHAKEPRTSFDELMDTSFDFSAFVLNRLNIKDITQEILVRLAFELLKGTCKSLTELEYHLEECSKATTERLDWHNHEGKPYPFDLNKPLPLILDHRGRQVIPQDFVINNDLEYLKGGDLRKRSNLRNRTIYTAYSDPKGVIYKDQNNRNRLMRADELHKFSDGTLNDLRTALNDIAKGIRKEYLPKRKWSGLDKRRARVMVQDINKQLYERRLMRNLEKFIGGREYGNDLRLLERTI
ncbi:hypothetical protein Tco_0858421 [Tanacetum coccineum]|uniref:Uncharacterized protein n=1 Tax=Tanacetum coccineum TaxID=301880 RepID=A0ABQ5BEQ8_9ASTR